MKCNSTYRIVATYTLVVLVLQVLVFQSAHHIFGHHNLGVASGKTDLQLSESGENYEACSICLFQFQPLEIPDIDVHVSLKKIDLKQKIIGTSYQYISQGYLQFCLRGPPQSIA